jgi:hypothetical protein
MYHFLLIVLSVLLSNILSMSAWAQGSKLLGVHDFEPDKHVTQLKSVGAEVVRLPVTWHLMEEAGAGQTADWFWKGLDAQVAAVEKAGAKLIIEMAQTPCWASSDPQKRCQDPKYIGYIKYPPTDVNNYGKAFARLAQRYKGRVLAYEIWNEPNFTGNWLPYGARPSVSNDGDGSFVDLAAAAKYAALVKATYSRLKAADPTAKVVAGSISGGDVAYVQALYKAGIKGYFDAFAIHPYTAAYPSNHLNHGKSFGPDECPVGASKFWCFKVGVEGIRNAMLAAGDDKQIWFTEFGFDSNTSWNGSGLAGQATHLQQAVNLINNWSFVPVACWYALVDLNSYENKREYQFGLFNSSLNIKPAGTKFKELMSSTNNKPILRSPIGNTATNIPLFSWQSVSGATQYTLWVNEYGTPNVPGKINKTYTPQSANCISGGLCTVTPNIVFAKANAEWWVTAKLGAGSFMSDAGKFTVTVGVLPPQLLKPTGSNNVKQPIYQWKPATEAERYYLWVNQYGGSGAADDIAGVVKMELTSKAASCTATLCQYKPTAKLVSGGAEWWVTAITKTGERAVSKSMYFSVK